MVLCWLDRNTCESSDTGTRQQSWTGLSSKRRMRRKYLGFFKSIRLGTRWTWICTTAFVPFQGKCGNLNVKGRAPLAQAMWHFEAPPHDPAPFQFSLSNATCWGIIEPNTDFLHFEIIKKTKTMWPHRNEKGRDKLMKMNCLNLSSVVSYVLLGACHCMLWNGFDHDLSSNIPHWLDLL